MPPIFTFCITEPEPLQTGQTVNFPDLSPVPLQVLQISFLWKVQFLMLPLQASSRERNIVVSTSGPFFRDLPFLRSQSPYYPNRSQTVLLETSVRIQQALLISRNRSSLSRSPLFLSGWYLADSFLKAFLIQFSEASYETSRTSQRVMDKEVQIKINNIFQMSKPYIYIHNLILSHTPQRKPSPSRLQTSCVLSQKRFIKQQVARALSFKKKKKCQQLEQRLQSIVGKKQVHRDAFLQLQSNFLDQLNK